MSQQESGQRMGHRTVVSGADGACVYVVQTGWKVGQDMKLRAANSSHPSGVLPPELEVLGGHHVAHAVDDQRPWGRMLRGGLCCGVRGVHNKARKKGTWGQGRGKRMPSEALGTPARITQGHCIPQSVQIGTASRVISLFCPCLVQLHSCSTAHCANWEFDIVLQRRLADTHVRPTCSETSY